MDGHRERKKKPEVKLSGDYLLKKMHPENDKKNNPEFKYKPEVAHP